MEKVEFKEKCARLVSRLDGYCNAKGLPRVHHYMKSEKELHVVAGNGVFDSIFVVWLDKDGWANWGIMG